MKGLRRRNTFLSNLNLPFEMELIQVKAELAKLKIKLADAIAQDLIATSRTFRILQQSKFAAGNLERVLLSTRETSNSVHVPVPVPAPAPAHIVFEHEHNEPAGSDEFYP
jgi:hypothetical protein